MDKTMIKVGMADFKVAKSPDALITLGLGSCVGIVLYDQYSKIGGLAHIMLPDSTQMKNNTNKAKFADTGIEVLLKEMKYRGAKTEYMVAKIAGGAHMFDFKNVEGAMRIGTRNTMAVKKELLKYKIPIVSEDTGANYGRTIEFHIDTGILLVKTIGHGVKEI